MRIIDIHVHVGDVLFGGEVSRSPGRIPFTPGWIMEISGYRTNTPPPGMKTISRYLEVLHNQRRNSAASLENLIRHSLPYGIGTSVVQPIEPQRMTKDNLELIADYKSSWRMKVCNSYSLDKIACEQGPGRAAAELAENAEPPLNILTFCSVHPRDPDKEAKVKEYIEGGSAGIKLHPIIQDLAPEDPAWMELLEIWSATGRPVLLHSGVSGYYYPRSARDGYGDAARYEKWIQSFPGVPFILAHLNMLRSEAVFELAYKYENVHADLSFHSAHKIRQAASRMGSHRVLFASDFPFTLPRYAVKAGMEGTDGDPELRRRFFCDNAAGLLGI